MTAKQKIFWLRLVTLIGLCLPALELAWRWYNGDLEPRPVTVATHSTGDWAVIFLMLSLAMTPARALFHTGRDHGSLPRGCSKKFLRD